MDVIANYLADRVRHKVPGVSLSTEIPIAIGSRQFWCRSLITPDAENDRRPRRLKEMGCRMIEANVHYHSLSTSHSFDEQALQGTYFL
jgi:hypothetical protein